MEKGGRKWLEEELGASVCVMRLNYGDGDAYMFVRSYTCMYVGTHHAMQEKNARGLPHLHTVR